MQSDVHTCSVNVLDLALRYTKPKVPWPTHKIPDGDRDGMINERRLQAGKIIFTFANSPLNNS